MTDLGMARRTRNRLVDSPQSWGARRRAERWSLTMKLFPQLEDLDVLDLGGTVESWLRAPVRPASVTVLNLGDTGSSPASWLRTVTGDACNAQQVLREAGAATQFDLVYSNSVIEHVGGHANRSRFAAEVQELAPRHWVQTPYRYFPVEPHWICPIFQFLPIQARARLSLVWPLAHSRPADLEQAITEVQWTELISLTEMRSYFPSSRLVRERFVGLTKSMVAVTGHD